MRDIIVSVIIPTYRRSQDIARAVDSVLSQTFKDFEVIVVDDNGIGTEEGDKTAAVMSRYAGEERVIYLRHEQNKNGAAARNTGIAAAKGRYISFLDDDDIYLSQRLCRMVEKMETLDESWGACYSAYVKNMKDGSRQYSAEKSEGDVFLQVLMRSLYIGTGSNLFFRKTAMDEIGEFDVSFRRNQDLEYLTRITGKYKMAYVDEVLMEAFYDIRTVSLTFEQTCERERLFRERFAHHLDGLSQKQKREVLIMYELDWIRLCIQKRKLFAAMETALKARIPLRVYWDYLCYAWNRKKNKTSYGFVVKL